MNIVYQTQNSNTPSIQTVSTALAANPKRIGFSIQNLGTNPLFICLGNGATSTTFHYVLKGGTAVSDGLGATFTQNDGAVYTGIVTTAGTAPSYTVFETAP